MALAPDEKNYVVDISQSLIALYSIVWVWTLNSFAFVKLAQICSGLPFMLYTCAMTFTHTEESRRDISAEALHGCFQAIDTAGDLSGEIGKLLVDIVHLPPIAVDAPVVLVDLGPHSLDLTFRGLEP